MNKARLATVALLSSFVLASCGGSDDTVAPPAPAPGPPAAPTDAERASAAETTVADNPDCDPAQLGSYYWEIGDENGVKVAGTRGSSPPSATAAMRVYSSSKWLYAANVAEKHSGVTDTDAPYLNFTSGYSTFGNAPFCLGSTIDECLVGRDDLDTTTAGRFAYDSGHMEHHAAAVMGMGDFDTAAMAADLNATVGNLGFTYFVQQPASGVVVSPQGYASFLRSMMRGDLKLGALLGSHAVCTNPAVSGCNAAFKPDNEGDDEAWKYSLGHWIESDPTIGDGAYSSPGGGGFYPWIDTKSKVPYYGIVARDAADHTDAKLPESDAGYHSARCGRLIRQAYRTGVAVTTTTTPTPSLQEP